ncbi:MULTISPECIES: hypothetical protein [Pseudomonadati]|uniref:hypothetical protein n=1 Tax=unclassified Halobacteriovorax TaxID=2639665 RepID=UPI000CD0C98D|nr:hypothetical protein [Halobacteriovorax sp. DA5]POB14549.1 hypothetical protein C0Z22_05505 [Halobacteriovorax sp. DA5]
MEQGNKNASNSSSASSDKPQNRGNRSRSNNRRRRKRPANASAANPNKAQQPQQGANKSAQSGQATNKKPSNKSSNRNRRRRGPSKNRRPNPQHLSGEDFIIVKYFNLLEQHIMARRKYFDNFERVGEKQREKLERNFIETQKTFLAFKERLKEEDLKVFEEKFESLKMDLTYSSNHELPVGEVEPEVTEEEIEDPHYLQTQVEANYADDTEESVGSLEDYKAYKGL